MDSTASCSRTVATIDLKLILMSHAFLKSVSKVVMISQREIHSSSVSQKADEEIWQILARLVQPEVRSSVDASSDKHGYCSSNQKVVRKLWGTTMVVQLRWRGFSATSTD